MESVQRVRYPSFDYANIDPSSIPLVEVIVRSDSSPPTPFRIGREDNWIVEWRDKTPEDEHLEIIDSVTTTATLPFLMRTRDGWYIEPDPMHAIARRLITPTVIILISSLLIHAIAPALTGIDVLSWLTQKTYKIGPLDYPALIFITFPLFMLPIILRNIANSRDIRRQNFYIQNPLNSPMIDYQINDRSLTIKSLKAPENVEIIGGRLQVGVAIPERETILKALNRNNNSQPPPGMSTPLPERRITSTEEHGTGVGEAIPMPVKHSRVLLLEPMRVRARGDFMKFIDGETINLQGPSERWPGSIYSSLIALHWELIIYAKRGNTKMRWVKPIIIPNSEKTINIETMPLRNSRSEISSDSN